MVELNPLQEKGPYPNASLNPCPFWMMIMTHIMQKKCHFSRACEPYMNLSKKNIYQIYSLNGEKIEPLISCPFLIMM